MKTIFEAAKEHNVKRRRINYELYGFYMKLI